MSFTKKVVTTYSKSLFQNVKNFESSENNTFDVTKIASGDKFVPDVYIIGEELLLIRSTLISSKRFFLTSMFLIFLLLISSFAIFP